jgi:peptidoglycan/LPS O-acetylase OafA/YrhL
MLLLSHSINGVLWSLQVEAVCSLAIVLAWLATRDSPLRVVLLLAAVLAVSPLFRGSNFFLYFPAFLLGALIDSVPKAVWSRRAVLGAGLAALVLSHLIVPHAVSRQVEMVGAMLVVGCIGAVPRPVLLTGPVQFLGAVSYPFYLAHPAALLLGKAVGIGAGTADPFATMALLAVFSVPLALAMAWLLHVAVEEPAMRARPRLTLSGLRLRFAAGRNSLPEPS